MRLDGKVVAITGSGSGLGREGAKLFASEGARVLVSDLVPGRAQRVAQEIAEAGGTAVGIDVDVRRENDVERLVATCVERFGGLDVMLANAGIPEPGLGQAGFVDSTLAGWNDVIAVNLTGVYLAFRIAARQMIAAGRGGNLLATTSAAAFVAYPGYPMYSASKSGGNGLVRAAAFELGRYGIRANALAPVHGMSVNFLLSPEAEVVGQSYEQLRPWNPDHRAMPLDVGRPPTLADHAQLALFLASDASAYMSGQAIQSVDGGTFARPAIVFPVDRGEADPGTSRVVPEELRAQIRTFE
jgi:NAD(P)-dependent dehydrogenase (short-subunit alcohol dehydrogenase family)